MRKIHLRYLTDQKIRWDVESKILWFGAKIDENNHDPYYLDVDEKYTYIVQSPADYISDIKIGKNTLRAELNNSLTDFITLENKTWKDFGVIGNKENFLHKIGLSNPNQDNIVTNMVADIRTKIDHQTGKTTTEYRTYISNNNGQWSVFPQKYTSAKKLARLLLPKSCKEVKLLKKDGFHLRGIG